MIKKIKITHYLCVLIFLLLLFSVEFLNGLNLSPKFFIQIPGNQNQSYFGYTVHLRSNTNHNSSSIIIGAPKGNSKFQTTLIEPGSVYECDKLFNGNPNCEEFLLNEKEIIETSESKFDAYPEHGMLGASIDGEEIRSGRFVACAPRWSNMKRRDPQSLLNGMCYWSSNTDSNIQRVTDMIPLVDRNPQQEEKDDGTTFYTLRYGQFGFSTHLTKASEVIFGTPGLNSWTGGVIQYKDWNKTISTNGDNRRRRSIEEELFGQITMSKTNLPEGVYFGYAVSSGIFENRMTEISYVASAPKYNDIGSVFIFKFENTNDKNLQFNEKSIRIFKQFIGDQIGEYFGASLCVIDVNGDQLDDVIIGAPRHSTERVDIDSGDEGRVYVFINKGNWEFEEPSFLNFNQIYLSQFGTSVASLGDLDQDGFNDVVVGAPYENYGRGAIYIYLGGKDGLNSEASQYIRAKDLNDNLFGFGFSVSRGVDIDNNHYNDLAVGAYISGDVVLFRSHPVAYLTGIIKPSVSKLNLDTKQFNIKVCIIYTGKFVPNNINILVDISADGPSFDSNIVIRDKQSKQNIELETEKCFPYGLYLKNRIQDFSMPVKVTMQLSIDENKIDKTIFCPTCPVLHPTSKENKTIVIPFSNGCKTDICKPELKLKAYFINSNFTIGSRENLILAISIRNSGEPAYVLKLQIISNLKDLKFVMKPEECSDTILPTELDNSTTCIYNSIKNDKHISLTIDTNNIPIDYNSLKFSVMVNSTGIETNYEDNKRSLEIPLLIQSDFEIHGTSSRDVIVFKNENGDVILNLDPINYTYTVQNLGPSPVRKSVATFRIPISYFNTEIFELLDFMASLQNQEINCTRTNINYNAENIQNKIVIREYIFPMNETLFFNCSGSEGIVCTSVVCEFDLMEKYEQKANIKFSLQPKAQNIDVILGGMQILEMDILTDVRPLITVHSERGGIVVYNQGTTFIDHIQSQNFIWWIILAIIVGLLVLSMITAALMKYGFFHRSHQKLLQAKLIKESTMELDIEELDVD